MINQSIGVDLGIIYAHTHARTAKLSTHQTAQCAVHRQREQQTDVAHGRLEGQTFPGGQQPTRPRLACGARGAIVDGLQLLEQQLLLLWVGRVVAGDRVRRLAAVVGRRRARDARLHVVHQFVQLVFDYHGENCGKLFVSQTIRLCLMHKHTRIREHRETRRVARTHPFGRTCRDQLVWLLGFRTTQSCWLLARLCCCALRVEWVCWGVCACARLECAGDDDFVGLVTSNAMCLCGAGFKYSAQTNFFFQTIFLLQNN